MVKTNLIQTIAIVAIPLFFSCNSINVSPEVQKALELSGRNKKELIKTIEHYSINPYDSLKLQAAFYLIENMEGLL